jgi:hypothetical protein
MNPEANAEHWTIEARAFRLALWCSHNFWVLRGPRGVWRGELHGLATDRRSGRPVPIGYARWHGLQAWHFEPGQHWSLCRPAQPSIAVLCGDASSILERWNRAVATAGLINQLDLDYPCCGLGWGSRWANSNSVYSYLGRAMGVSPPRFVGLWQPGLDRPILEA